MWPRESEALVDKIYEKETLNKYVSFVIIATFKIKCLRYIIKYDIVYTCKSKWERRNNFGTIREAVVGENSLVMVI